MDSVRLQALVKRVTQQALRRPGAAPGARAGGVHVALGGSKAREEDRSPRSTGAAQGERGLITQEDLARTPDGGRLRVPAGAQVTPLARDEAWRRRIRLEESGVAASGAALRVALGADHGGFPFKQRLVAWLRERGHQPLDLGTHGTDSVDYPDFAQAVGEAVATGRADFGVCIDGAGIGSSIAANKVPGVRAALCWDEATARNAREHNFANVLSLGGPLLGEEQCARLLEVFLTTPEGAERHERRVDKIMAIEGRYAGRTTPTRRVLAPETKT